MISQAQSGSRSQGSRKAAATRHEEDDAGDGDLPAGVVGEGDQGDQDGADGDQGEDGQAHPHRAREADGERGAGHLRIATPRVGWFGGAARSPGRDR